MIRYKAARIALRERAAVSGRAYLLLDAPGVLPGSPLAPVRDVF